MNRDVFTTVQVANLCHVHQTTVINWVKEGRIKFYLTPGGHRRIRKSDLIQFFKDSKLPVPEEFAGDISSSIVVYDTSLDLVTHRLNTELKQSGFDVAVVTTPFDLGLTMAEKHPDLLVIYFGSEAINDIYDSLRKRSQFKKLRCFAVIDNASQSVALNGLDFSADNTFVLGQEGIAPKIQKLFARA